MNLDIWENQKPLVVVEITTNIWYYDMKRGKIEQEKDFIACKYMGISSENPQNTYTTTTGSSEYAIT